MHLAASAIFKPKEKAEKCGKNVEIKTTISQWIHICRDKKTTLPSMFTSCVIFLEN